MQIRINPKDGATLVWIAAGTFVMGSSKEEVQRLFLKYEWDESWFNSQVGGESWTGELSGLLHFKLKKKSHWSRAAWKPSRACSK